MALVLLFVGLLGWNNIRIVSDESNELTSKHMPLMDHLERINTSLFMLEKSVMTLLIPGLTEEDMENEIREIKKAQKVRLEEFNGALEHLDNNGKEKNLYQSLKKSMRKYDKNVSKFLSLIKDLEKSGVADPKDLLINIEKFQVEHYRLISEASYMLYTKKNF